MSLKPSPIVPRTSAEQPFDSAVLTISICEGRSFADSEAGPRKVILYPYLDAASSAPFFTDCQNACDSPLATTAIVLSFVVEESPLPPSVCVPQLASGSATSIVASNTLRIRVFLMSFFLSFFRIWRLFLFYPCFSIGTARPITLTASVLLPFF